MSFNSESKSKRRGSSNPSSCSNNSSGDKKANSKKQKTLGMAWGANSRSSSHTASKNSPFSDFGSYMAVKNQKLHEQFDAAATSTSYSESSSAKSIFYGVSIFVDGYTVPSSQELRGYMLKHGGRFENYFSRRRVTHIICSNLPDSKIKNLRAFSRGLPVVKPTWVLDSVAANKLLSWIPYQLDQLAIENDNQQKLSTFFTLKNSRISETAEPISEEDTQSLNQSNSNLFEEYESLEHEKQCSAEPDDLLQLDSDKLIAEEPACSVESYCGGKQIESSEISPNRPNDKSYKASSSRTSLTPKQGHSTLADPNFVENYFKNSRLHFIGTWRNRYQKRFPSSSNGFRYKSVSPKTTIIHIDMDCFFVSVVIRNHPELQDKPVAVCHSDNPRGTAEISSANYPARDHGIKAGIFVKDAMILCPQLVIVPYDFGAYEKVADQFYDILHKHCNQVQAVSCDEAFLDVTESEVEDPQLLASIIRKEIFDATGCSASVGISCNMLMARLATKKAKPDGQCYIPTEEVDNYLCALSVKALPGIGRVLEENLKKVNIVTCGQLRLISKDSLQKDFGTKTGEMLWNYSRGIDNRLVGAIQERKSIGAEVNWGVRFRNPNDSQHFLTNLCKEVALRLHGCRVQGRTFTLKIKKRRIDSGEPVKYMGCGDCENLSHSITIPVATDDVDVLQRLANQLFGYFNIDDRDIRGVGLQVSKLEGSDDNRLVQKSSILSWLVSNSTKTENQHRIGGPPNRGDAGPSAAGAILPPLHDLDMAVIESLPPEIVSEINDTYGGKLLSFISENRRKISYSNATPAASLGSEDVGSKSSTIRVGNEVEDFKGKNVVLENSLTISAKERKNEELQESISDKNLMPSSLSQIDWSTLEHLPEELRKDVLDLPPHRTPEFAKGSSSNLIELEDFASNKNLWTGDPPQWVDKFKTSSCSILNVFANIYRSRTGCCLLSSLLQHLISDTNLCQETGSDGSEEDVSWLFELFKQYIGLKIEIDIEEIYLCICLLRRLTDKSKFLAQVFINIVPHLQASVSEKYGGTLHIPSVNS